MQYKELVDDIKRSYETESFTVFPDTEVLWIPETSSLYIRGSDSWIDWIFNFLILSWNALGFHHGFFIKGLWLLDKIHEKDIKPKAVVGHSAGGAVAQIIGYMFDCDTYSVASPKTVCNPPTCFTSWANEKLVIIAHVDDIVSKLPPNLKHPTQVLVLEKDEYGLFANHLIGID